MSEFWHIHGHFDATVRQEGGFCPVHPIAPEASEEIVRPRTPADDIRDLLVPWPGRADRPVEVAPRPPRRLSQLLEEFAGQGTEPLSLGDLAVALSDRSIVALIILFAAPNLLPLPPGSSAVFGVPLILISGQLLIGRSRAWLPRRLARLSLDRGTFARITGRLVPLLGRFERLARPRFWPGAAGERLVGLAILVMALVLTLPIPLGNWMPAVAIMLMSLGLAERDGLWLAFGALVAAGSLGLVAGVVLSLEFAAAGL